MGLPRTRQELDSILVVVDQFSQTDGQTEVINRTLGNLLQTLEEIGQGHGILCWHKQSSPRTVQSIVQQAKTPFEIMYGRTPLHILDVTPISNPGHFNANADDLTDHLKEVYDNVHRKLAEAYEQYKAAAGKSHHPKEFNEGDLVMVYLRCDRFPEGKYHKLKHWKIGPCLILKHIRTNAHHLELPKGIMIIPIFNISDLFKYHGEAYTIN
ncbi:uncharacterized protein LOC110006757 [Amborella trichopoda]|uniref:uncharacterized protein LOC110006757 n=1 Tax=Amborella trichopoda TaxID=13333 RepID=UPI0009C1A09E|nr:uncharacterized protein LOC110006757 [Amborella trichopoda]|eukprot:XP_020519441.1 uncharacterized protein LOC110006757 [Amborella trichopoda]